MRQKTLFSLLLTLLFSSATAAQTAPAPQAKVDLISDRETIHFAPEETAQALRLVVIDLRVRNIALLTELPAVP